MSTHLLATQRRFLAALLEPLVGDNRSLAELPPGAPAPSPAFAATADALLRSTPGLHARERLGLYQRQYWFRLLDSLNEDFPRVRTLLGPATFQALLERYLAARPPSSWTLRHLGAGLAGHLRSDPELDPALRPWAAALADCEYAEFPAFEAPALPQPQNEDFPARPLQLQPCVCLVPVDRPLSRLPDAAPPPLTLLHSPRPRRELHVIWRDSGHHIRTRREPLALLPLLRSLQKGGLLNDIITRTPALPPPSSLSAAFTRWRTLGWLALQAPSLPVSA